MRGLQHEESAEELAPVCHLELVTLLGVGEPEELEGPGQLLRNLGAVGRPEPRQQRRAALKDSGQ